MPTATVQIQGADLVVDGNTIPYGEQVLREDQLFLTDLGREVGLNDVVLTYDQQYYEHTLLNEIVCSLETAHPSVGHQIMTDLLPSPPQQWILIYLFQKISLRKLQSIISYDPFFLYLLDCAVKLTRPSSPPYEVENASMHLSGHLKQALTRMMLLYRTVHSGSGDFKESIQKTVREYVDEKLNEKGFLGSLAVIKTQSELFPQLKEEDEQLNPLFLKRIISTVAVVSELASLPQDYTKFKEEEMLFMGDKSLYGTLLSFDSVAIIKKHLKALVIQQRQDLIVVLQLFFSQHGPSFWSNLFSDEESTEAIKILVSHYMLDGGKEWSSVISLLYGMIQTHNIDFYQSLFETLGHIHHNPTLEEMELIRALISHCCTHLIVREDSKFISFVIGYYIPLSTIVTKLHQNSLHLSRGPNGGVSSTKICEYLKQYSLFFKLDIPEVIPSFDYCQPIKALLSLSKKRKGVVFGSRKELIDTATNFLSERGVDMKKQEGKRRLSEKVTLNRFRHSQKSKEHFMMELRSLIFDHS